MFRVMRLVTGEASNRGGPFAEIRIGACHRVSFNRVIGGEGFIQAEVLATLQLVESQCHSPGNCSGPLSIMNFQPSSDVTSHAYILRRRQ